MIAVDMSESAKNWKTLSDVLDRLLAALPRPEGLLLIVGGGTMLNLGAFAASVLHRGRIPCVLVPTTIMAIADVVVGSKTGVNHTSSSGSKHLKNILGVYDNPGAVLLDRSFVRTLTSAQKKLGLSEVLKHGLLQDESLYRATMAALKQPDPGAGVCVDLALRAMDLKRAVLAVDPWEDDFGKVLLYGHYHAHSVERALKFSINHGQAVFYGLLMDLRLAGPSGLFDDVRSMLVSQEHLMPPGVAELTEADLRAGYDNDTYFEFGAVSTVRLTGVANYPMPPTAPLLRKNLTWAEIWSAHTEIVASF